MANCQDDGVISSCHFQSFSKCTIIVHFEKESSHRKSGLLSYEEVDSWPLKVTFLTFVGHVC